jgi:hypothetical protein
MAHQGFVSRTVTRRRNIQKHKEKGLCVCCSKKTTEGRMKCEQCLERDREYMRKYVKNEEDKQIKKDCKFFNGQFCCNKQNTDYQTKKKFGHFRLRPKRCLTKYCPFKSIT